MFGHTFFQNNPFFSFDTKTMASASVPTAMGKKSFTCSICQCKHQSARGQQCKQLKSTLPIFTSYVRKFDTSKETSFSRNTDESLGTVFAIRRIMAFMHSNTDAFQAWCEENPIAEVGLESSVVSASNDADEEQDEEANGFEDPAQFIRNVARPVVVASAPPILTTTTATTAGTDKGPAPPTLSYTFLTRAPKITALVLKR